MTVPTVSALCRQTKRLLSLLGIKHNENQSLQLLFRDLLDLITVFSHESRYETNLVAPAVVNRNVLDGQEITLSW